MLRTNLSTRPFYNERAVHFALILAAAIVLAVTFVNAVRIIQLSRHSTELSSRIGQERSEADRLMKEATEIRRGIDQKELKLVVQAAREANTLIDRRTFSWTSFFNQIETTMPADVMLQAVRPKIEEGVTRVEMSVVGRHYENVQEFIEKLEATPVFENVGVREQHENDEGLLEMRLEAVYTPRSVAAQPAGKPAVRR